jgi:uncharacterized protein
MKTVRLGHPAPWPFVELDTAAIRKSGHRPTPFRQIILKIHSRCNLSCSYCYVYEMADQSWRQMPKRMSRAIVTKSVERIAEHVKEHSLASVDIILHGGEPLLAGPDWLSELISELRYGVPTQVNIGMQTNGTLLDRPMLETLKALGVSIGVSLDGDVEATGLHRRFANGRNSFDAIARGLKLLQEPEFRDCYSGILCTIDVRNDPIATYKALLKFGPPAIDFLLPHANWSSPPPGSGYAEWLIAVFERWYSAPREETRIRLFSELIQLVLGQPGAVEGLGLLPTSLVVVDTDGSIKQLDSLSSTYPGAADTGMHVNSNSFDDALDHPTTVARQIGADALSPKCQGCDVVEICGGGLYPHRFQRGTGFRNPSVYCDDLFRLTTHVRDRVLKDVRELSVLDARLDFGRQTSALLRGACLRVLWGKCVLIAAEHRGEPLFRTSPVARRELINGEIGGCHERVRVLRAERIAALYQGLLTELDRVTQPAARSKVRRVVDIHRQHMRVLVTINFDEAFPRPLIVRQRLPRASCDSQYGREVHKCCVVQVVRAVRIQATIAGITG